MSDFSADWLRLREPADSHARAQWLLEQLETRLQPAWPRDGRPIVDLGAGSGANLRYLAPRLGSGQRWRCLDHDPSLLDQLPMITAGWARTNGYEFCSDHDGFLISGPGWDATVAIEQRDLKVEISAITAETGGLITASALLDLVSQPWLQDIITNARRAGCALLFALSYDGRVRLLPAHATDRRVNQLVNRHQHRDKGFGPALGPDAPVVAVRLAERAGYRVRLAASDWRIDARQPALQQALIAGWVEAALEIDAQAKPAITDWHRRRLREISQGTLTIEVGHRDMLATTT